MAYALITGMRSSTLQADVTVGEPDAARRQQLENENIRTTESNVQAVQDADLVFLAVKPQLFSKAVRGLRSVLTADQTVVSIMAGVRLKSIKEALNHGNLVRVMPNTPAQIGCGMSVWYAAKNVPEQSMQLVGSILKTVGDELLVHDEEMLDAATAMSGSGPAFVFVFIEALQDAGIESGMSPNQARRIAIQTVLGSAKLVQETGKHPAELKNAVTSPAGTTAAGLQVLEDRGFRAATAAAVLSAWQRAKELSSKASK